MPNVMLGIRSKFTGVTWEREDAKEPHYRGLFDDNGRLTAIFCHNTVLGDGWERERENEYYFSQHMLVADGRAIEFYRKCGFERAGNTEPMRIYAGHDHWEEGVTQRNR